MEKNKAKLEALWLSYIAYCLKVSTQNTKNRKGKEKDEEYKPT